MHKALTNCSVLLLGLLLPVAARADIDIDLGRGPVTVHVPASYDPEVPAPLVMLLHGYSSSGAQQEAYMQFRPRSEEYGFLYLYPDGLTNTFGFRYWNATDACCDFEGGNPDDSGYLRALLDEVINQLNVDPRRVFVMGHSNGGFMSYRMACDHADLVAAIMSLAGATHDDPADCTPSAPVDVLQIHGTLDTVIRYDGGFIGSNAYPGAIESVQTWAGYNGCDLVPDDTADPLDLDAGIAGAETSVSRYETGCEEGGSGELWTIHGGSHTPNLSADFTQLVVEWLFAHPKPATVTVEETSPLLVGAALPQPFRERVTLPYELVRGGTVAISIFDTAGRHVRDVARGWLPAGPHYADWDGRDAAARNVAAGVYFVRIEVPGRSLLRRVVRIR